MRSALEQAEFPAVLPRRMRSALEQAEFPAVLNRIVSAGNAELPVNRAGVSLDRVSREVQLLADLAGGQRSPQEPEHGPLAFGQRLGGTPGPRRPGEPSFEAFQP